LINNGKLTAVIEEKKISLCRLAEPVMNMMRAIKVRGKRMNAFWM
jgi:hypothetical protein